MLLVTDFEPFQKGECSVSVWIILMRSFEHSVPASEFQIESMVSSYCSGAVTWCCLHGVVRDANMFQMADAEIMLGIDRGGSSTSTLRGSVGLGSLNWGGYWKNFVGHMFKYAASDKVIMSQNFHAKCPVTVNRNLFGEGILGVRTLTRGMIPLTPLRFIFHFLVQCSDLLFACSRQSCNSLVNSPWINCKISFHNLPSDSGGGGYNGPVLFP